MSKSISLIKAGATATLLNAAAGLVSKATGGAVSTPMVKHASKHAVVVGVRPPRGVYAALTRPPPQPHESYANVRTVVVHAILPRENDGEVLLRDALDVYPAAGIACSAEVKTATAAFAKAAELAVRQAKEAGLTRITVVTKPATKYENLNHTFEQAVLRVVEAAGLSVEQMSTAQAANQLVVFPEKLGVVLTNDDPTNENIAFSFAGVTGGAHMTYFTEDGGTISGGHSYVSVARALAEELVALGLEAEAKKIEAAAAQGQP